MCHCKSKYNTMINEIKFPSVTHNTYVCTYLPKWFYRNCKSPNVKWWNDIQCHGIWKVSMSFFLCIKRVVYKSNQLSVTAATFQKKNLTRLEYRQPFISIVRFSVLKHFNKDSSIYDLYMLPSRCSWYHAYSHFSC